MESSLITIRRFEQMLLIRRFEERLLELFSLGDLFGTTHTSIGQEAIAVGVLDNIIALILLLVIIDVMATISHQQEMSPGFLQR